MQSFVLSLTLFRILAAPFVFITAIFLNNHWLAFWLFNLAALTDYFDGKLARDFKVESRLGTILDPIGDKLLVMFSIITVIVFTQDIYVALMGALILAREFLISALREFSSVKNISSKTSVTFIAKAKTTFQFIAISMFFFGAATNLALLSFIANFILFIALLLAFKSAIDYFVSTFIS
jgi:CDP-diacylglycerol--glycerol-3-phosphate 3-phosphatidyltransferase